MRRALTVALLLIAAFFATQALSEAPAQREISSAPFAAPPQTPSPSRAPKQLPRAPDRASPEVGAASTSRDVVAVALDKDDKVALIDPLAGRVVRTLDAGASPGGFALAPDGQSAWVFSRKPGQNAVSVIDLVKAEKRDDRHFRDGDGPAGVAFSSDGERAYVALAGEQSSPPAPPAVAFVSTATGSEFGRITLGRQTNGVQIQRELSSVAVSPAARGDVLFVAAHASGVVWALDAGSGAMRAELEVGGGPTGIVPDPPRQRAYVVLDTVNQVAAIDTSTLSISARIDLPAHPAGAAVGPDGSLYVVGGESGGEVWVIPPGTAEIHARAALAGRPTGAAISSDGRQLYVAEADTRTLRLYAIATLQPGVSISLGAEPFGVVASRAVQPARATPSPTRGVGATPTLTPTIVPPPTPLPEGVRPPEHLPAGVVSEDFLSRADFPVSLAFAPDGRLFYNELRTGRIRVVQDGQLLADPFYEFVVAGQPETGLIGLTLDPNFTQNHYVYVFYTSVPDGAERGGPNGPNQVVRLTDVSNKGVQLTSIMRDLPSGPIHNSGTLRFGPDGKLYIALGDNDHGANAEDLNTLAGKILRVNPDGSVPDDNPFVGRPGAQTAIWAYGFRNPYSFGFHPLGHEVLAVENGPGDNDELDVIVRAGNYGWPPTGYKYKAGITDPIAVMNPTIGPTGSTFYVGDQIPEWKNDWFYCNYHQGQLRRVRLAAGSFDRIVYEEVAKQGCSLDVTTGPDGALYYTDAKGIYRLRRPGANVLPSVKAAANATAVPTETLPSGTRAEDRDLDITLSEWALHPSRTTVPTGSIRVLAENVGATQHALRITGGGIDVSTEAYGPAQSRTLQIVLSAGTYQLTCPIPGHVEQGMQATLNVVGADP